jgi:hypothetical protein
MASIPIWYFTADSTWAAILLTSIDAIGFGPTIRKVFAYPYDEDLRFFALFALRNPLVVIATALISAFSGYYVCYLFV